MRTEHTFKAEYVEGRGIVVTDSRDGSEVKVSYGATSDCSTCYAHTECGFIGGWNCMPKSAKMKFRHLVESINRGVLYSSTDDLPTGRKYAKRKTLYLNAAY